MYKFITSDNKAWLESEINKFAENHYIESVQYSTYVVDKIVCHCVMIEYAERG